MLDDFSKRNKAIRAALELAAERGWNDVSLHRYRPSAPA